MKNMILNELDADILDHISGGTNESEDSNLLKPLIGICSNCGARVMLSCVNRNPCSQCGVTPTAP